MARRGHRDVEPGQAYCVEWPEWHVECAHEGCEEFTLLAAMGEAWNVRQAEQSFLENSEHWRNGWVKRERRWYCRAHAATT